MGHRRTTRCLQARNMSSAPKSRSPLHQRFREDCAPGSVPLWSIFLFAAIGFSGALSIAFMGNAPASDTLRFVGAQPDVPIYSARAVPFESTPATTRIIERRQNANSATEVHGAANRPADSASRSSHAEQSEEAAAFGASEIPSPPFTIASAAASLVAGPGGGTQSSSSGYAAPDAESFEVTVVPEPSTILTGLALGLLVVGRWLRSTWHRRTHASRR